MPYEEAMASNGNNVKVLSDDGTTAPVPQNADLWHSRALSGHLRASGEDAGVDRRVDCDLVHRGHPER